MPKTGLLDVGTLLSEIGFELRNPDHARFLCIEVRVEVCRAP